jgi:hypothetical protein
MKKILFGMMLLVGTAAMAKPYGDAGCGLGSIVFGDEGGFKQVFAATLNGTGVQTFGISSGTSNCTDGGRVADGKEVPMYIEVNRVALAKDAARGQGETLAGLANLLGCEPNKLGATLKQNYSPIFVETGMEATGIQNGINKAIETNKSQACGA